MSPALIALIIGLVEEVIKNEPTIAAEIKSIFAKANPTPADWQALKDKIASASFESLAPDAKTV